VPSVVRKTFLLLFLLVERTHRAEVCPAGEEVRRMDGAEDGWCGGWMVRRMDGAEDGWCGGWMVRRMVGEENE
jgi:hypothetical protein